MNIFGRKSENEKRLSATRNELTTAQRRLDVRAAKETEALADGAAYSTWRAGRDADASEVYRLTHLIAALEAGEEAARQYDIDEALRKRVDAARKNSATIAERLKTDGVRLSTELKALARDVATSQVETAAINRLLSDAGMPSLADANNLARGRLQYHPEGWSEIPEFFHTTLRLPHFDRQGVDFDGSRLIEQDVAGMNLEPAKAEKKSRRPVQTELIPVETWTPTIMKPVGSL